MLLYVSHLLPPYISTLNSFLSQWYYWTVGTDVRKLVADGYPGRNVLGTDLRQEFLDIGYKLYQDSPSSNPIRFFTSDIFDVPSPLSLPPLPSTTKELPPLSPQQQPLILLSEISNLTQLRGRINHFYLGALFHLFNESTQYEIALRVASLLDLSRKEGVVVFGRHQGLEVAGIIDDHLGRYELL